MEGAGKVTPSPSDGSRTLARTVDQARTHDVIDKVSDAARPVMDRIASGAHQAVDKIASATLLAIDMLRRDFGVARPRVGVLGLNPHAGEAGMFGAEEATTIGPAIDMIRRNGGDLEVTGPLVPDAAFRQPMDLFVAMYHDQGLIPIKLIDFDSSVNVTLGLPIVRTSPDHGVAYDIAGRGLARPTSFVAALELCARCVDARG